MRKQALVAVRMVLCASGGAYFGATFGASVGSGFGGVFGDAEAGFAGGALLGGVVAGIGGALVGIRLKEGSEVVPIPDYAGPPDA